MVDIVARLLAKKNASIAEGSITPEKTSFISCQGETVKPVAQFTNQVQNALDTSLDGIYASGAGFKQGKLSSTTGIESTSSSYYVTGLIPVQEGQTLRTNALFKNTTDTTYNFCLYDAEAAFIWGINIVNLLSSTSHGTASVDSNNQLTWENLLGNGSSREVAFVRITFSASGTDSASPIVTLDEKIVYTQRTVAAKMVLDADIELPQLEDLTIFEGKDYVLEEAALVAAKINEKLTGNTFYLLCASDIHYFDSNTVEAAVTDAANGMRCVAKLAPPDCAALLGDYIWGGGTSTLEESKAQFAFINRKFSTIGIGHTCLWLDGNHDCIPQNVDGYFTPDDLYARIGRHNQSARINAVNRSSNYGFVDYPQQMVRVIYLNTEDRDGFTPPDNFFSANYGRITDMQMQFFASALDLNGKVNADAWKIVILSHHPLDWPTGSYDDVNGTTFVFNVNDTVSLLTAYENGTSCTVRNKVYDFSSIPAATVICNIHGHTHNYNTGMLTDTIRRIAIPNVYPAGNNKYAGDTNYSSYGDDTTYGKTAATAESTAFCAVLIDTAAKTIDCIHYGAGVDRSYSYTDNAGVLADAIPVITGEDYALISAEGVGF